MGAAISQRPEPEVHVVVVQSQDNGQVGAKVVRKTRYRNMKNPTVNANINYSESDEEITSDKQSQNEKQQQTYSSGYMLTQEASSPIHSHSQTLAKTSSEREKLSTHRESAANINSDPRQQHEKHSKKEKRMSEELSQTGETGRTMFELFRTFDGEEYTVYMRDDGKRFYVDFEEQKWRYFPSSWEDRGYFLAIDYDPYEKYSNSELGKQFSDSRSGEFIHPTKGKLVTYLRQEMQNVLYFLDEASGSWLPMPLNWERHVPNITSIIDKVQKTCPDWKDVRSIVALLRQCNYNVDDCISTYSSFNDDGVLDTADGSGRDILRAKLEQKLAETKLQLTEVQQKTIELKKRNADTQSKLLELEVENQLLKKELERKIQDQKRISKVQQKQSSLLRPQMINPVAVQPLLHIVREDARSLQSKLVSLKNTFTKSFKSYRADFDQFGILIMQLLRVHRRQAKEIGEVRSLYQKEALQRKLLYNEVQELRGNIRVFCRCRFDGSAICALKFDSSGMVVCTTPQGRKKTYDFEKIFPPDTTQEEVFQDTKAIITSCVDGYNVCIIAYGQTGAGKTYTMMGTMEQPGVNIRSMRELFKICKERTKIKYTMKVAIVEVYNEAVFDLLAPPNEGHEKLQIVRLGKETVVQGLTQIEVRSMNDVLMIMHEGDQNRTVADTKMNTNSSRSHQVLMLHVEGYDSVSKTTSHGKLTLVDLAGSERISRSEATGIRLVEAAAINKSLSALGQVFTSIRNNALHIPYRNSKLTYLLQPSIGGDSKACIFVNISPLSSNMAETISTLEFGQNVRQVELGQAYKHLTKNC